MAEHMADEPPRQLGQYHLRELLKGGGEARVYKGTNSTRKVVAIRVLEVNENTEDVRRRFEREVRHLKELGDYPYIISLIDFGWEKKWAYLVMPYVSGGSLGDLLGKQQLSFQKTLI